MVNTKRTPLEQGKRYARYYWCLAVLRARRYMRRLRRQIGGQRWLRIGAVGLIIFTVCIPVIEHMLDLKSYQLDAQSIKLLGANNENLVKKFTYDQQQDAWQFNKGGSAVQQRALEQSLPAGSDAAAGIAGAMAQMRAQVGGGGAKDDTLYSADLFTDASKGIRYYDNNTSLSFSMVPQFKAHKGKLWQGRLIYPVNDSMKLVYTAKTNGIKEDVVLTKAPKADELQFSYKLNLPSTLEARLNDDGSLGVYSADPTLFSDQASANADQAKVESARESAPKNHAVFAIPAPILKDAQGQEDTAAYSLDGDVLTVAANRLHALKYPLSIDPSVVITSSSDFSTGNSDDNMINYSTAGQIGTAAVTGGTTSGGFSTTTAFSTARIATSSVVYNGYAYVIGGGPYGATLSDVQYAPVNTNGTITGGSWATTTALSVSRSYAKAFAYNGYMYLIGGVTGNTTYASDVQYAVINNNGTLGAWAATTSLSGARSSAAAAAYNGYLYVFGGYDGSSVYNTVQYAKFKADGTLSAWATTASFTTARSGLSGGIYNGYAYIMGGYDGGSNYYSDAQYAKVNSDGTFGSWITTTAFTTARTGQSTLFYGGYVYMLGGTTNVGTGLNNTQYAQVNANGTFGTWSAGSNLSTAVFNAAGVSNNGYLYMFGGQVSSGTYTTAVQLAKIDTYGRTPGFGTASNNFSTARAIACSVAYNGYLYAIGGSTNDSGNNNVTNVDYSALNPTTGNNGSWTPTTALPEPRGTFGCTAYNGYIYVVGGWINAGAGSRDAGTRYAPINSNGTLGSWVTGTDLPNKATRSGVFTFTTTTGTTYIYSIGGTGSDTGTGVYYATLAANGSIGAWSTSASSTLSNYASRTYAMVGNHFYAIGGVNSGVHNNVEYTTIANDGTLSSWQATGTLNTAIAYSGGAVVNGCIYNLGGENNGGTALANVEYACPAANGTISAWTTGTSLSVATTDIAATSYSGYLYLVGGYTTSVQSTTLYVQVNNGGSGNAGAWHYTQNSIDNGTTNTVDGGFSGRDRAGSVVYNGYAYVAGGSGEGNVRLNSVQYASLNTDGTVGAWTNTSSLITARTYVGMVAYNGYMYVLGGTNNFTTSYNDIQYAPINANGSLGAWHYTHSSTDDGTTFVSGFTTGRYALTSVVNNGYVYVLGGSDATTAYSDVQYAPLNADGTVGTWASTTSFNTARFGHSSLAYNGVLYVMGGRNVAGTTYYNDVQYATMNTNGTIGSWSNTTNFNVARYGAGVAAANGFVYLVAGTNASQRNDVQYAPINANGTLGNWNNTSTIMTVRDSPSVLQNNGYLYMIGGFDGNDTGYSDVQYAPLNVISHKARYSKLVDLGSAGTLASVVYSGSASALSSVQYATAGTDGVLSALSSGAAGTGTDPGTTCTSGTVRYVYLLVTLDDSQFANFASGVGSNITDISIYFANGTRPQTAQRLHGGKQFYNQSITGLDICGA